MKPSGRVCFCEMLGHFTKQAAVMAGLSYNSFIMKQVIKQNYFEFRGTFGHNKIENQKLL